MTARATRRLTHGGGGGGSRWTATAASAAVAAAQQRHAMAPTPAPPGRPNGVNNHGYDDDKYDYIAVQGEEFGGRYVVHANIGTGSFSKVRTSHLLPP